MTSKGAIDLDAILEETIKTEKLIDTSNKPSEPSEKELKIRVVNDDVKPWLAFSANVQKDYRDKWTKMVKVDIDTEIVSKFQSSSAYRSWDGALPQKNGINRALQDIVRKAATMSNLVEAKATRLLTLVNPVTDGENGKRLQKAFAKQLITDFAKDIKDDPNYEEAKFPALASTLVKT